MINNEVIAEIRAVLIKDWDPLGIGTNLNLGDEYDGYIGSIIHILMYTPSLESIISLLKKIENEDMGIENTDTKYLYPIATKLVKIGEKFHI
ncbi:hypothetical protein [Bacteroides congonensis]